MSSSRGRGSGRAPSESEATQAAPSSSTLGSEDGAVGFDVGQSFPQKSFKRSKKIYWTVCLLGWTIPSVLWAFYVNFQAFQSFPMIVQQLIIIWPDQTFP